MEQLKFYGIVTSVTKDPTETIAYSKNINKDDSCTGFFNFTDHNTLWELRVNIVGNEVKIRGYFGGSGRIGGLSLDLSLKDNSGDILSTINSPADLSAISFKSWGEASFNILADPGQPVLEVAGVRLDSCAPATPSGLSIK